MLCQASDHLSIEWSSLYRDAVHPHRQHHPCRNSWSVNGLLRPAATWPASHLEASYSLQTRTWTSISTAHSRSHPPCIRPVQRDPSLPTSLYKLVSVMYLPIPLQRAFIPHSSLTPVTLSVAGRRLLFSVTLSPTFTSINQHDQDTGPPRPRRHREACFRARHRPSRMD
jgi:hypothetical protein